MNELDINKVSFTTGYTLHPDGFDADVDNRYSTNGNIQIYISNTVNANSNTRTAHELYYHGRFYMLGVPLNHKTHDKPNWYNLYEKQAK